MEHSVFLGINFFVFILFAVVIIVVLRSRNSKYQMVYATQVQKRGAKIIKVLGVCSQIEYMLKGQPVRVGISHGGKNAPPSTSMKISLQGTQNFNLYVAPEFMLSRWAKKLGMQDIQVMNLEFDDAFIVRSNDEGKVRQILTHEVQQSLLRFKDQHPCLRNYTKKYMIFSVNRAILDQAELEAFLDQGEVILKQIMALSL